MLVVGLWAKLRSSCHADICSSVFLMDSWVLHVTVLGKCMTPAPNDAPRAIRLRLYHRYFGFVFVQLEEVEMHRPS